MCEGDRMIVTVPCYFIGSKERPITFFDCGNPVDRLQDAELFMRKEDAVQELSKFDEADLYMIYEGHIELNV